MPVGCYIVHNMLMIGNPGTGKSMLVKRLPKIHQPLTPAESLETTRIYSSTDQPGQRRGPASARHGNTSTVTSVQRLSRASFVRMRSQPASIAAARCRASAVLKPWSARNCAARSNAFAVNGTS